MFDVNPLSDYLYNVFSNTELMIVLNIIIYSVVFYLWIKDLRELL